MAYYFLLLGQEGHSHTLVQVWKKNRVTSHARNKNEKKYPWLNEETGLKKEFKSCF
jgi:hypothetical protein